MHKFAVPAEDISLCGTYLLAALASAAVRLAANASAAFLALSTCGALPPAHVITRV